MYLTKGHNNLTKLNEITNCICGRFSFYTNIWLWVDFHIIEELYFIFVFLKNNTPDIKHHARSIS
jgi:hypothetical protein